MQFLDLKSKFDAAGINKTLANIILLQFANDIMNVYTIENNDRVFLCVYGSKNKSYYTRYYYDMYGNEHEEEISHKKLAHFSYDQESRIYKKHLSEKPVIANDTDKLYRSFEIYESKFEKKQSLAGFDPALNRPSNIFQLCDGEIKFNTQYNICDRIFLEFSVINKTNFPGPRMIESNGKLLTNWEGSEFEVFPKLGIIKQSKKRDIDGTNMTEYNLFDVTKNDNPCLLNSKVNLRVQENGHISHGTKKGFVIGTYGVINIPAGEITISKLRELYYQHQQ